MCKEDPYRVLTVYAELEDMPSPGLGGQDKESPGTPPGPSSAPKQQHASDTSSCDQDSERTAVFFARVPPLVPREELLQLFGQFGTVLDLNLFKRWSTAKASKGCGTVKYSTPEAASAALLALHGVYTFEAHQGCEGPMVVEWMDASRLTSADAAGRCFLLCCLFPAAAQKAAKSKATAAAAAASKPQQHKAHRSKPSGSSSAQNSASQLPSWSYLNNMNSISSISALAQYINAENRAMAALAAAGAAGTGFAGGLHPAVEALDLSGLMGGCGPLSPDAGCSSVSSGLGDPSSWSTVVPVHLLRIMSQPQPANSMGSTCLNPLSPLLPPAAAATFSQMNLSGALLPSPGAAAAAAAAMPSPANSGACGLQQFASGPHACSSGAFGCVTPGLEPWMSGGLPSCTIDSTSRSFSAQLGGTPGGAASASHDLGFYAAVAAAEQQQQQQQQTQQLLQQQQQQQQTQQQQQRMMPLMMFEDAWVSQSCEGLAQGANTNTGVASNPRHASSGSGYALFDTNAILMQVNDAAAAAGASNVGNATHSASRTLGFCAGGGGADVTGTFAGPLNRLQVGAHGYLPMHGSSSASKDAAAGRRNDNAAGRGGSSAAQQQQGGSSSSSSTTIYMPLTETQFSAVVPHILSVMKMSGAKLNTSGDSAEEVYQLGIQGSAAEIEAAQNLVHLLLSAGANA